MIHAATDVPPLALLLALWAHGAVVGGCVVALACVARRWVEP